MERGFIPLPYRHRHPSAQGNHKSTTYLKEEEMEKQRFPSAHKIRAVHAKALPILTHIQIQIHR